MTHAIVSAAVAAALLAATPALAVERHHDMSGGPHFGDFRGNRVRSETFRPAFHGDRDAWRRGGWRHERHDGRFGWWWVVDDFWAFYPEPIYPYPAYAYDEDQPPPPMATATWYYCAHPQGYYPYVRSCDAPWQPVPAQPQP